MNFNLSIGKFNLQFGQLQAKAETAPQKGLSFTPPTKSYTYAPLRTALLPTPSQLRQAIIQAGSDPRPLMDILRKLAIADMHLFGEAQTRRDAVLGFEFDIVPDDSLKTNTEEMRRCSEIKARLYATNYTDAVETITSGVIYGHSLAVPHWELDQFSKYFPRFEGVEFVHFTPKNGHLKLIADPSNQEFFISIGNNSSISGVNDPISVSQKLNSTEGALLLDLPEDDLLITIVNPFVGLIKDYTGGLMRPGLFLTLLKHYDLIDWAKFNELFGMPLRVGKFDEVVSSPEAIATLQTAVKNIGVDAAAVIDKTCEIEFVDGKSKGGTGSDTYEKFANYIENKQSILMLGQTMSNQVTAKYGSRSLGQVQNLVRADKLYSDIMTVEPRMTKVIQRDYFYNYGVAPKNLYPKFRFRTEENEDLEILSNVVRNLTSAGLPVSREWAYDKFDILSPKDDKDSFGQSQFNGLI